MIREFAMVNKKFSVRILVLSIFFLIAGTFAFAQEETYYIVEDEKGNQTIMQTFKWEKSDDVFKYGFILQQKLPKGEWKTLIEEETETTKYDVSLGAGEYRYKVMAYNFLGNLEVDTGWIDVEIIRAYMPKISDVTPATLFLEEEQDGIFSISGSELREETEFYLIPGKTMRLGGLIPQVLEHNKRNNHVKLQFDPNLIDSNKYSLIAKNNGGLKTSYYPITVQFKKPVDFDVAAGYAPVFFLSDSIMKSKSGKDISFNAAMGDQMFYFLSPNVRLTFIPVKKKIGNFGVMINATAFPVMSNVADYELNGWILMGSAQFIYQFYPIKKRLCLDVHAGVGVFSLLNLGFKFPHGIEIEDKMNSLALTANVGLDAQFYILKRLYVEAGVEVGIPVYGWSPLTLQPQVAVGWQF